MYYGRQEENESFRSLKTKLCYFADISGTIFLDFLQNIYSIWSFLQVNPHTKYFSVNLSDHEVKFLSNI